MLVCFGPSWYVPVHDVPRHGAVGGRARAPGRPRRRRCDAAEGVAEAAALLRDGGVERIVATGNGAAYYVAHALWLAALEGAPGGPPIVAVPCGVAVRDRFRWEPGDAVLAVSSSGEFRDVVELAQRGGRPCVAITASADSSLAAAATATVLQHVAGQRAVTHTQAVAGAYACGLARLGGGDRRRGARRAAGDRPRRGGRRGRRRRGVGTGLGDLHVPHAAVVAGGGVAWAAAMELALMLKEISRVPAEGVETREGSTSAMFGLDRGHLMVSLDPRGRPARRGGAASCAPRPARPPCGCRAPTALDTRLTPDHHAPGGRRARGRAGARGRARRRQADLDRRLLPDRAGRDVSVRLGVVGCGSVFWTPYMGLIEKLRGQGRVEVDRRLRLRPGEAPRRRRAARPHAGPARRRRGVRAPGRRRRARAHEHDRARPARPRRARGRQARARREAGGHVAGGGRGGARRRRGRARAPALRAAHPALADLPRRCTRACAPARSAGC